MNGAIRLQGYLDAIQDCKRLVEGKTRPYAEEATEPY